VIFVFSGGGVGEYYLCQMYGFFSKKDFYLNRMFYFWAWNMGGLHVGRL
jgi:hypothetical protein